MRLGTLGTVPFLVCLGTSIGLFIWRVTGVLRRIGRSKPESGFRLRPFSARFGRFLREVVFQTKVIKERPWAGVAHALVFWGFCAFALITMNHVASGLGFELLPREGFGRIYRISVAVFAVAVAVSILGLAARRFLARPRWLGKISLESGVIALLIFLLMVTYLADFRLAEGSIQARINWWIHSAALLVFLPVIPRTKHFHLLLSPITVFFERQGFSSIPPLQGDEDFGLIAGKDITRINSLQAYTCVECGRCTEHCPATLTGKILDPKEIVLGTRRYLEEFGPTSDQPLLGKHLSMVAAFECTTCGSCEYQCPVGIQHLPLIIGLRRGAVNTGKWEDDYGTKLFLNLERKGNAIGLAPTERDEFIRRNSLPLFDGSQDYCLWLGCMGAYDPNGRQIVLALAEVLQFLKISFGVLRKEQCNGEPARRLGNDLLFETLARANLEEIDKCKVRRLLTICPHCVRTMKDDWKEFGANLQIEHHSELLARHSASLPQANGNRPVVAYHDACYLGRYRNIFNEPREVISQFGSLAEPKRSRRRGFCCGAGGGRYFLGEEKGKRVSLERAEQLASTGAASTGTACPFCNSMLKDAMAGLSSQTPVVDIAQMAADSLRQRAARPEPV